MDAPALRRAIAALDASGLFAAPGGELSLVILDARSMGRLHADFLGDPSPTDVITFDGDPALGAAGEICLCAEVARDFAAAHGGAFARELLLYLVHGYLHLAGFDDTAAPLRRAMRVAERRALQAIDRAGTVVAPVAAWR